ncbi:MAG: biotin--[acetyl-CoA-carboxylase] ligase [Desulfobacterales bacterium]|nr:biotin--[acetyl-CoA-carboxylase] ligase [Desulfobacterales bacterium]
MTHLYSKQSIESDILTIQDFPSRSDRMWFYSEVNSTMEVAREKANAECPHFTVVVSDRQTSGRGRLNRNWISEQGGLYFTMVLRFNVALAMSPRIVFAASYTLAHVLRNRFQVNAGLKWPNDILVQEKKIAGILAESCIQGNSLAFMTIGIGLNVNNEPHPIDQQACSIKQITGQFVSRKTVLTWFLDEFEEMLSSDQYLESISLWRKYAITLNRNVAIKTPHGTVHGLAADIDENGALILRQENGKIEVVRFGDCFFN